MSGPTAVGSVPRREHLLPCAESRTPLQLVPSGGEGFDGLAFWFQTLDDWIEYLEVARECAPETIHEYESYLQRFFRMAWRKLGVLPHTLTEQQLNQLLRSMKPRSPVKNAYLKAVRSYYRWAVARRVHDVDPARDVRVRKRAAPPARAHDLNTVRRLLEAARARSEQRYWAIILLFETSGRIGQVAEVMTEDVPDPSPGGLIHFRIVKHDYPYATNLTPLAAQAVRELRRLRESGPWAGTRPTLIGVGKNALGNWVREACVAIGLPEGWRNAHLLRSTSITELYKRTKSPELVRRRANHRNYQSLDRYVAMMDEDMREATSESLLGEGAGP